jgi:hypothetical protein
MIQIRMVAPVQARPFPEHRKHLLIVSEGSVLKRPGHGGFSATLLGLAF